MQIVDSKKQKPFNVDEKKSGILGTVEESYLRSVVESLAYSRHYIEDPENNKRAANRIAESFQSFGYDVLFSGPYKNVVATHPKCPPGPVVLVGSHYDTVPGTPGADDNSSAVAVSLACAKALVEYPELAPVMFVSFNREEDDLLGSKQFVKEHLPSCPYEIGIAHVLEMVGYRSFETGSQKMPPGLPIKGPDIGDFLALISNRKSNRFVKDLLKSASTYCEDLHVMALKVFFGLEKKFPHLLRSDHAPFWQEGIPAIMWTDTSEFRNDNYHAATDLPETLDYDFMKQITQLLIAAILKHV